MNILLLVSLIAAPVFLCILFRRRLEEMMAPFFCALMLVLYGRCSAR